MHARARKDIHFFRRIFMHLKITVTRWWDNDPFTQAAAVAYYTIFSFPALIILYLASASLFLQQDDLQAQTNSFLSEKFGASAAEQFSTIIQNTAPEHTSTLAFVIGGITLLLAALKLFMQLQKALNHVWGLPEVPSGSIATLIFRRLTSFMVMLGIGLTLVCSILLTSVISFFTRWITEHVHEHLAFVVHGINLFASLLTLSIVFTIMLRNLPDKDVRWRHAFPGALISAVLFMIGEYGLGIYFSTARPDSAYGVTGSLILLMLWVSYSCIILLLGAEMSKTLSDYDRSSQKS